MKLIKSAAAAALLFLSAPAVHAATLTATTTGYNGSFFIEFDDTNGNMLFDYDELVSFSGFTSVFDQTIVSVLYVPEIAGISVAGGASGAKISSTTGWYFESDGNVDNNWDFSVPSSLWTYEITGLSAVPLPASTFLLLGSLGGLIGAGRRKRIAG